MSVELEHGGPAFPVADTKAAMPATVNAMKAMARGMTLRDYFAAKAMHQMLRGAVIPHGYDASNDFAAVSERAYELADAMLRAREPA